MEVEKEIPKWFARPWKCAENLYELTSSPDNHLSKIRLKRVILYVKSFHLKDAAVGCPIRVGHFFNSAQLKFSPLMDCMRTCAHTASWLLLCSSARNVHKQFFDTILFHSNQALKNHPPYLMLLTEAVYPLGSARIKLHFSVPSGVSIMCRN